MERWIELIDLANKARTVRSGYRGAAKRLASAIESLELARRFEHENWPQSVESAGSNYDSARGSAEDFWQCLREIATSTPLWLRDIANDLVHVDLVSDRWHDQKDFPWDAALAELRRIDHAARRAADDAKAEADARMTELVSTLGVREPAFRDQFISESERTADCKTDEAESNARLVVSVDPPQATIDGTPIALGIEQAIFLQRLIGAEGDWLTGPKNFLDAMTRPDRVFKSLPDTLRELVESGGPKGYRISRKSLMA